MKQILKRAIVLLLLCGYLHAGVVGHLITWTVIDGWSRSEEQVSKSKSTIPASAKVYWTQHKHIPSSAKTISSAVAVLPAVHPSTSLRPLRYIFFSSMCVPLSVCEVTTPPRAPPSPSVSM